MHITATVKVAEGHDGELQGVCACLTLSYSPYDKNSFAYFKMVVSSLLRIAGLSTVELTLFVLSYLVFKKKDHGLGEQKSKLRAFVQHLNYPDVKCRLT